MNVTSSQTTDTASERESPLHVEQLGEGEPTLAIVGAIHGDEPCGAQAIEALLAEAPPVEQPVKCIIANPRALAKNIRYIDTDLNRTFPGDPTADAHEQRVAVALLAELQGCTVFSMHSTQSYDRPFAIVDTTGPLTETVCPYLSIDALVEVAGHVENTLADHARVIEVECGQQGSDQAAENATKLVYEFLAATGALPDTTPPHEQPLPVFTLHDPIPKPAGESYAVHVPNFERVPKGTHYATIDETELIADESFYPVLLSPNGYESQFGYTAELTQTLGEKSR
jgi:predicted deacylase